MRSEADEHSRRREWVLLPIFIAPVPIGVRFTCSFSRGRHGHRPVNDDRSDRRGERTGARARRGAAAVAGGRTARRAGRRCRTDLRDPGDPARGFVRLATIGPAVTIFGSVRTPQDHANCRLMRQVGAAFGAAGYAFVTGRGPRLMEAANPGEPEMWERCRWDAVSSCPTWKAVTIIWTSAFASGTSSRARSCSSARPPHSSLAREDSGRSTSCSALTLIQTRTIKDLPVIPVGEGEWDELSDWLRERVLADRRIDSDDLVQRALSSLYM